MNLNEKKAYEIYEEGGYSAVIDACNEGKLKYDKWGSCEPCESEQPIYNNACLSCGSTYYGEYDSLNDEYDGIIGDKKENK